MQTPAERQKKKFLSTPSGWRATLCNLVRSTAKSGFLSTPSGWRATSSPNLVPSLTVPISIHALRVEGDKCPVRSLPSIVNFYPRPPGGGRLSSLAIGQPPNIFLSTPSGWRATRGCWPAPYGSTHFYPRPPGGGRPGARPLCYPYQDFYPRPPGGGRPVAGDSILRVISISIHALRVEGDGSPQCKAPACPYFYPRPPGGGRLPARSWCPAMRHFYPRPPGGGRQQKRTKFSSVFAQKGEEFASLRRGKRKICRWCFKKDKFWVLIWCEGSGKSVCASASHCG